jgi:hypothetical protein
MSEDQTTQTAVDTTKTPAVPGAEVAGARNDGDDLDKLLADFDDSKKAPPEPAKPEPTGADHDLKAVLDEVRGLRTERQQETFRKDMDTTVKDVRGNLDPEFFDDVFVESWMDAQARQDPRLAQAWANRHANPKQFQKVVDTLGRSFVKKYGNLPDKAATEDRDAVAHAVRGASTKAPPEKAPDFSKMSPGEFQAEKDRMFGN